MMQPIDEEAQRAIREALASDDTEAMLQQGVSVPNKLPAIDDTGSYMSPNEISADNDIASLQQLKSDVQLSPMSPQMGGDSQVTLAQREQIQKPSGGFDWGRALWAAGGGDLASFDAQRNREQERQDKQVADFDAKQLVRKAMDPQSDISRQRQQEYAQQMQSRANIAQQTGMPDLARTFADEANRASTMSATQIDRASQSMGGIMKESLSAMDALAKHDLARQGLDLKQRTAAATEALARGNFGLRADEMAYKREERAKAIADKEEKENEKEQAALGKDIAPLNETKALLSQAAEQKKKVNTGLLSNWWETKVKAPLGLKDKDFTSLEATQGTINNAIMKLQSGGTITDNEAFRLRQQLADLSQDDPEFDIKLKQMMDTINIKIGEVKAAHPNAAKTRDAKEAKTADQQALEWANANPGDPRAAKIKEKLGVK